jgi:hypothetical protein
MTGDHVGPPVASGETGTARFAKTVFDSFDVARATETLKFVDGFYRAPANDGFDAVLDHLEAKLRAAGYGSKEGFEIEVLSTELRAETWTGAEPEIVSAWTPISAKISLKRTDGTETVLHEMRASSDTDRVMLPIYAPSADVEGRVALSLDELESGMLLVTQAAPARSVLERASRDGAKAVISSYLAPYNVDPNGAGREKDALQFRSLPCGVPIAVAMISPASFEKIRAAREADRGATVALHAEVKLEPKKLRTLCARIVGRTRPNEAIAIASHVQEPGACDNASGVAGLCESACEIAGSIERGAIQRPARTLVFLWGDEMRQSSTWLDSTKLTTVAGLSSDMTGESRERTGAIALLERMPDPAAITPLPPDQHTPWGQTQVDPNSLAPNGVALIARCAIHDVAAIDAGWKTAEHPYEGGSDHDVFIARRIPAALFWHFTDFTYHTSLDRLENVDAAEMRRSAAALIATALALADPEPADLARYLQSLNDELDVRLHAAESAQDEQTAKSWRDWCTGARHWLRGECLHLPPEQR